jgi:hypothetical protein
LPVVRGDEDDAVAVGQVAKWHVALDSRLCTSSAQNHTRNGSGAGIDMASGQSHEESVNRRGNRAVDDPAWLGGD